MSKNKKKTSEITRMTICALLAALSFVLMCIGSVIEILDLSIVMVASLPILFCVIEMNKKYAFLTYAVTSLISILLLPGSRFSALVYILSAGIYPIIKPFFDKIKKPLRYLPKLLFAIADFSLIFVMSAWLFPQNEENGKWMLIAMGLLGLFVFFLYDILLDRITILYLYKWKKILGIKDL